MHNHSRRNASVIVKVVELSQQFVFMPPNSQVEIFSKVKLVDESLFLAQDWQQNILDTNLQLCSIDVPKVLLEALEAHINLLILACYV